MPSTTDPPPSGLQTPPMFPDLAVPPTPMDEEEINRLLGQDMEETPMDVYNAGMTVLAVSATVVVPPREPRVPTPATSPSPSGSPERGEPSKLTNDDLDDNRGQSTASLADTRNSQLLEDQRFQSSNFQWVEDVTDTRLTDMQLKWKELEQSYLTRISRLEESMVRVKTALDLAPLHLPMGRHQVEGHADQEQSVYNVSDEEGDRELQERDLQDGVLQNRLGPSRGQGHRSDGHSAKVTGSARYREDPQDARGHLGRVNSERGVFKHLPLRKSKAARRLLSRPTSASHSFRRCNQAELVSIFRVYYKAEAVTYIKGLSLLLANIKNLIFVNNTEVLNCLTTGSDQSKYQTLQQIAKHLNVLQSESELVSSMSRGNLLEVPARYSSVQTFPPLLNVAPLTKLNTLNVFNSCWTTQGVFQRNRLCKFISLLHPKLASCLMSLQGDQQHMVLLKNLFPKETNPWVQAFNHVVLMTVTSVFDLDRNRQFYDNTGSKEVFLPQNVSSHQFENQVFDTREISWNREQFVNCFRSLKVTTPLKNLDNLHLQELEVVKSILNRPY